MLRERFEQAYCEGSVVPKEDAGARTGPQVHLAQDAKRLRCLGVRQIIDSLQSGRLHVFTK